MLGPASGADGETETAPGGRGESVLENRRADRVPHHRSAGTEASEGRVLSPASRISNLGHVRLGSFPREARPFVPEPRTVPGGPDPGDDVRRPGLRGRAVRVLQSLGEHVFPGSAPGAGGSVAVIPATSPPERHPGAQTQNNTPGDPHSGL